MADLLYKYGVRPAVRFKHTRRAQRTSNANLGRVCIIGAFPTVSESLLHFTDLETARKDLGIEGTEAEYEYVKSDVTEEYHYNEAYYPGAAALRWAFMGGTEEPGAREVLVCNISTYKLEVITTEGQNGNPGTTTIKPACDSNGKEIINDTLQHSEGLEGTDSPSKLEVALSKLKNEDFDSLIFAVPLEHDYTNVGEDGLDTSIKDILLKLREFAHISYGARKPIGMYIGIKVPPKDDEATPVTTTSTITTAIPPSVVDSFVETNKSRTINAPLAIKYLKLFENPVHCAHSLYSMVFTGINVDKRGYTLSPLETAAYLCGVESGLPVDTIMGQRTLPHMTGVDEELNYDPYYKDSNDVQNDGIKLLANGATLFECTNRTTNEWAIVNSAQPCTYDISHLRTSAFILKQIALSPFLCKLNHDVTRESVDSVIASLKERYMNRFPGIISIDHHIAEKRSKSCIEIFLYINFYGIIIDEIVYVAMGVEEDE